jgi:hypothetical protein
MPRRNRAKRADMPLRGGFASTRSESGADGDWIVRQVPGSQATKVYRCPGCQQEIGPGTPHVVAWPQHGTVEERRHWHGSCWQARGRRGPTSRRW